LNEVGDLLQDSLSVNFDFCNIRLCNFDVRPLLATLSHAKIRLSGSVAT